MFDRIFSAALAFCVLAGATLAVGSALFEEPGQQQIVQLPRVEVTGKRAVSVKIVQAEQASSPQVQ